MQKCDQEKKKKRETKMFIVMWKYTIWKFYILLRPIWWHCEKCNNQFSSVAQLCLTLCNPMDCSMPGLPVHYQLLKLAQTHAHQVSDAIQPSYPLSSPSPPSLNLSQHQGVFQWVSSSHQVAQVLEFQLQHQSFQWTHNKCCHTLCNFVQIINTLVWFPLAEKNSLAP